MDRSMRSLTRHFEPVAGPNSGGQNGQTQPRLDEQQQTRLVPPSVNIVPPQSEPDIQPIEEASAENFENRNGEGKNFSLSNIFKSRGPNNRKATLPKLSLRTSSVAKGHIGSPHLSERSFSQSSAEHSSTTRLRRRSNESRSSRLSSNSATDQPPRSAKVLSFIEADDMDEFQDLQKGFHSATNNEGLSWLPQLSPKGAASDVEGASEEVELDPEENTQIGIADRMMVGSSAAESTRPSTTSKKRTAESYTYEKEEDETTFVVEVADLDDIPGRGTKKPVKLYGNSLGMISPTNRIRIKLALLHCDLRYKIFYQLVLMLFTILMAVRTYNPSQLSFIYSFTYWIDYLAFFCCIMFTLNDITKIIAFGFWDDSQMFAAQGKGYKSLSDTLGITKLHRSLRNKYGSRIVDFIIPFKVAGEGEEGKHLKKVLATGLTKTSSFDDETNYNFQSPRAFLRSSWNRIDFTSTVCFWIGLFLAIRRYDTRNGIRIFKTLAVLRILRLVNTDTGLSSILRGVKQAIPQLINVGSMLVYFWVLFGVLSVQSFKGSLRRQCVWFNQVDPTDTYEYNMQFCGGYLEPGTKKHMPYIFEDGTTGPVSKGFLCPEYSKCISNANPYNGRLSFDNIVNAMELVFVVISANTFTDLMYYTMDSDEMAASLFFVVTIFVLTIWLMNLVIAVLVTSFELANEKFKKQKLEVKMLESWPVRITQGYWKYFQVKAQQTRMPPWAEKGQSLLDRIQIVFVTLIVVDLVMRCKLDSSVPDDYNQIFLKTDLTICSLLFAESAIRVLLHIHNPWKFLIKWSYLYDLTIGIAALIITILKFHGVIDHTYYWLSVFHISRFYRVVYLFGFTSSLWKRVLGNRLMIWNLSAFYFFFTFLVSIILSVFFEGVVPDDTMSAQQFAMYSLPNSFLSLFIIGSTENWTSILYTVQSYSPNTSSSFFSSVLLIIWFILSNTVILNIFIALISETMEVNEEEKRPLQIKHYLKYTYPRKIKEYTHATFLERLRRKLFQSGKSEDSRDFKQFLMRGTAIMNIAQSLDGLTDEVKSDFPTIDLPQNIRVPFEKLTYYFSFLQRWKIYAHNPFYKKPEVLFTECDDGPHRTFVLQLDEFEDEKLNYLTKHPSFNYSYFILPPHHAFRRFCQCLVPPSVGKRTDGIRFYDDDTDVYGQKIYFHRIERDLFVLCMAIVTILLIVFSCAVTPLYRRQHKLGTWSWPTYLDCAFVVVFTLEFIVKTVADGVFYTPNGYLRNPWNVIDFIVLISLWINFIAFVKNDGDLSRIFKGLTALRALRCLTISHMARQTFNLVVFDGIKKIFEAAFVSLTLLFPFTVWGMNIFRGRLGTCNDGTKDQVSCYDEFANTVFGWDILMPRVYQQPELHLDSFGSAFRSLYEIVSLEGWSDLLQNMMNSTGIGTVTSIFASPQNAVFLVLFNFLSMVFILNLFVSFIINNHAQTTGSAYFTTEEKSWLEAKKLLSQAKPKSIPNLFELSNSRRFFYRLAVEKSNFYYALLLQLFLYLHIIMLLCRSYHKPGTGGQSEDAFFMISTTLFLGQEIFHLYGEGFRLYKKSAWNRIRFVIVATSFILTAVGLSLSNNAKSFTNVKELFHLMFFLFIIPQNDMLSELIQTAVASWPPILSLTYTWGILFLVYAIALNQIFGLTKLGRNTSGNINFRTITKSLIVLFRCSFGEGWNYIMADLTVSSPYCYSLNGSDSDCGSKLYAYLLLMSWNVLSMYIFVNMFISLIMGNFSYVYRRGGSKSPIGRRDILNFIEAWAKLDTDGSGDLEFSFLPKLMHSFDGPLSFCIWEGRLTVRNLVKNYMEVNPEDPYDVKIDLDGLNKELSLIDKRKIIQRRLQYRRFVQEVHYTDAYNGAMKFSNVLQLVPLYTTYDPRECLGIDEYVRHLYNLGKVDKFLENEKNVEVLNMVVTRWKYKANKRNNILKAPINVQTFEIGSNPFADSMERPSSELNIASTPLMDFGVDQFIWSPRNNRRGNINDKL
ncbi:hypothetical protein HG537_0A01320 [Torulaspora globosa]|uniref:Calcium-channel protein CCH1 n=1 Tax=Torulaspora globosa TaxID=48254 RepID=A0A7H9HNF8_9SACH|nr:hypothetical protein HG537_0A01320 [Torulaspora sp. CBS 2947]